MSALPTMPEEPSNTLQRAGSAIRPAFKWVKRKSRSDGYGNRWQLVCCGCDTVVYDADWGNGAGLAYFKSGYVEAGKTHYKKCKACRDFARQNQAQPGPCKEQ